MRNNYIKVLGIQLKVDLDCNETNEYLIETKEYYDQIEKVKEVIHKKNPDIIAIPEMCYVEELDEYYLKLSKNKLIIAGSIYQNGINYTVVFSNKNKYLIRKYNASGAEPMIRFQESTTTDDFIKYHLNEHIFKIKEKKILVLNCMEYYQHAYTISRKYNDIFAIVCICSNSNQKVFIEESKAIHNHCENIYSFVINCISNYQKEEYAKGNTYIFGPIQYHEQDWLKKEGYDIENHSCSILKLSNKPEYFYGEFTNNFSRFGRSDYYLNNPKNIEIGTL